MLFDFENTYIFVFLNFVNFHRLNVNIFLD